MTLENGWPECDLSDTERLTIPGTELSLPIRSGQPHAIMQAFFRDMDAYIEPANNARGYNDEGSWTENNSVYTSNHKGATAVDWNWTDHAFGVKDGGWDGSILIPNRSQVPAVRELLAWYEGMIFWGNDWNSPIDGMHFQMGYNTCGASNFARVQSFIDRKIRADGFSTFRRGGMPRGGGSAAAPDAPSNPIAPTTGLTAEVLYRIAGEPDEMPIARYRELLPIVLDMFRQSNCNTIDRRAMMIAQVFHESSGLYYKREIASGAAYEGRCDDLGNCQPGDGVRFRGRGFIQLTGRSHAEEFSRWMYAKGLSLTDREFVDHPERMETDKNAALVTVFYWTVSRPQLNALADARNLEGATRAVNGGLTGLASRRAYYNAALEANADLLDPTSVDPWEELLMSDPVASWSIYAKPGEAKIEPLNLLRAVDAKIHRDLTDEDARNGDLEAIRRVALAATGNGANSSPGAVAHALGVLNSINAVHPEWIVAATTGKAN